MSRNELPEKPSQYVSACYVMLYCVKVMNQLIRIRVLQQMKYVRQSCAKNSSPTIILNIRYYTVSTTRRGYGPVFPGEVVESSRIAEKKKHLERWSDIVSRY